MNKYKLVFYLCFIFLFFSLSVDLNYAHPGRTDSNGCHTCRTNCENYGLDYGEYHCHNTKSSSNTKTYSNSDSDDSGYNSNSSNGEDSTGLLVVLGLGATGFAGYALGKKN